jgi:hypothetical protein
MVSIGSKLLPASYMIIDLTWKYHLQRHTQSNVSEDIRTVLSNALSITLRNGHGRGRETDLAGRSDAYRAVLARCVRHQ